MKRWNGWGDESIELVVNADALQFLEQRVGPGVAPVDATLAQACAGMPASRLPAHPLVVTSAEVRLRSSLGHSLPDWLKMRSGKVGTVADGVAFPQTSEQVRELLDYAQACGAAVIPMGGGTSVVGHLTVPEGAQPVLTVNLTRICSLINLDRQAQLATFGAGVLGPDLEAQLRAHGYTLGHFPQSFEYSTLGGWVVTRSSGQQSLRYGRIEAMFAGGRVETPTGTLNVATFPASASGTDLRETVLGSEGRIGILTEATVRVTPLPEQEEFHTIFFPDWDRAQEAVRAMVQAKVPLSMLRLANPVETLTTLTMAGHKSLIGMLETYLGWRACKDEKCLLMLGASGRAAGVQHALAEAKRIARRYQGVAIGQSMGKKWKENRFRNVYLRNALWLKGYAIDTAETACDWTQVKPMMLALETAATHALAKDGEKVHTYTHLSHIYAQGASVYTTFAYRLAGDYAKDLARWRRLKSAVSEAIVANGGTISHQHGVGIDHAQYLEAEKGAAGIAAMRALFQHFDPSGMMNPGKLLLAQMP
jgi:alkyldihydroxyacetonephosphate synthase